jgi:hypothetical protein
MGLVCFRDTSFLASLLLDWEMNMSGLNLIFLALGDFFFFFFYFEAVRVIKKMNQRMREAF